MQHIDDETLALLALGEDVLDGDARTHVASCRECAATVSDLTAVVDDARSAHADGVELVAPSPDVWTRIEAELGLTGAPDGADGASRARSVPGASPEPAPSASPEAPPPASPEPAPFASPGPAPDGGTVVPMSSRRRRTWLPVAAAACLALVVGAGAGVWWSYDAGTPAPVPTITPQATLATAELEPLPDWGDASGEARLEETPDGRRQVVVTVDAPTPEGAYREVWLLAPDVSGLVSLGVLEGTEGTFDVPDGLDVTAFPVVDVSEEHFDGDPSHSGDSVVRGPLDV